MTFLANFLSTYPILSFYIILALALSLSRIPKVGRIFFVINTLVHEASHALMAILSSGKALRIQLFQDTSGTALTQSSSRFSAILISLAGYIGASAFGILAYELISRGKPEYLIYTLMGICLLCLIFFIRNSYGIFWGIGFLLVNFLLFYFDFNILIKIASLFYAGIIFSESFISATRIMLISFKKPASAGDAANLRKNALLPAFFWGILFFLFALACNAFVVWKYFPY